MENAKSIGKWFVANWERVLFVLVGLAFLGSCFYLIYVEKITEAAVVFGLGFLSFLYANVARFKRFKGLGFEAELWEDKQKEAADLIERLRGILEIYTRQIVVGSVGPGRWIEDGGPWKSRRALFDELNIQHNRLGEKFDMSPVKKLMDDCLLYDVSMPVSNAVSDRITQGKLQSHEVMKIQCGVTSFVGNQSSDVRAWLGKLDEIRSTISDPFDAVSSDRFPRELRVLFDESKQALKDRFGIEIELGDWLEAHLGRLEKLYAQRPLIITDDLISYANRELIDPKKPLNLPSMPPLSGEVKNVTSSSSDTGIIRPLV